MAFQKKTWKDRIVEFAGRRTLTKVAGSVDENLVVDVARNEGLVSQTGDVFSAANMNDLEQRISDAFNFELIQTLSPDETTVTFTDSAITDDSSFNFYTSVFGVNPIGASVSGNTLTLTFPAQKEDITVKVKVM